jgi:hypothetical protein
MNIQILDSNHYECSEYNCRHRAVLYIDVGNVEMMYLCQKHAEKLGASLHSTLMLHELGK